jgi:hypothetical protein
MNKCIECQHIRGSQTMQKHGLGLCAKMQDKHHFVSACFSRLCVDFKQDDDETIAARLAKVAG